MMKMKIAKIYRITWSTMALFAGLVVHNNALGQLKSGFYSENSYTEFNLNIQQPEQGSAVSSKWFQQSILNADISEMKQNEGFVQNGMKLDSIEEYNFIGWQSKRFKYFFGYENGSLKHKRCIHFGKSYSDSLGLTEEWTYNKLQQLEKYESLKKLTNWHDTIIVDEENSYEYLGDTVIVKTVSTLRHFFYTDGTYNDVKYEAGDVLYNSYQERYTYNEKGQLTKYEGGEWYVNHVFFEYDDFGNLIYLYHHPNYVENYDYQYTERKIDITSRYYVFNEEVVPFDSITEWVETGDYWHFGLDQFGRDSICTSYLYYSGMSTSRFEYDLNGNISYISISFRDEADTTKWLEQGRLQYTYNSNNLIASFLQTFYDEHWNHWDIQNSKNYFYSEVKSVELKPAPENERGELKIYPNPAGAIINIEGISGSNTNYHIYDLYGRQMLSGNLLNPVIDVSGLSRGTYLLKINDGQSINIQRFVKQ